MDLEGGETSGMHLFWITRHVLLHTDGAWVHDVPRGTEGIRRTYQLHGRAPRGTKPASQRPQWFSFFVFRAPVFHKTAVIRWIHAQICGVLGLFVWGNPPRQSQSVGIASRFHAANHRRAFGLIRCRSLAVGRGITNDDARAM